MSLWQGVIVLCAVSSVLCTRDLRYKEISDTSRVCLATYSKHLKNELIHGQWYFVCKFAIMLYLPYSTECQQILFERPSEEELNLYKKHFNSTRMPYTFEEDLVLYSVSYTGSSGNKYFDGLLIGGREAKFFLPRPRKYLDREAYDVIVLRYIDENYMILEDCSLGGNVKWIISKKNHPSDEELVKVISRQCDLKAMENQKYCELEED